MAGYVFSALAAAGLMTAGVTAAGGLRSVDALPVVALAQGAGGAGQCSVKVVRTGTPGAADIVRDQLPGGGCVCVVTTGPASNNGSAEGIVNNLLSGRECSTAPAANAVNNVGSEVAGAGAGGGGAGAVLPVLLGAVAAGGLAAALGNASNG